MGYDPDETIGTMNVLDYVHPEDLSHVLEETEKALGEGGVATKRGRVPLQAQGRLVAVDGERGHLPARRPGGGGVVVTSRNVTERKIDKSFVKGLGGRSRTRP